MVRYLFNSSLSLPFALQKLRPYWNYRNCWKKVHLCTYLAAGFEPETFGFWAQVANYFILKVGIDKVFTKYFKRSYWTPPKEIYISINVCGFSKFYSELYITVWYTPVTHEQCVFIIYWSVGRKRTKKFSTFVKINWTKISIYIGTSLAYFYK